MSSPALPTQTYRFVVYIDFTAPAVLLPQGFPTQLTSDIIAGISADTNLGSLQLGDVEAFQVTSAS